MLNVLEQKIKEVGTKHPHLKDFLMDVYGYAMAEIEDGESEYNEVELALDSIDDRLRAEGLIS